MDGGIEGYVMRSSLGALLSGHDAQRNQVNFSDHELVRLAGLESAVPVQIAGEDGLNDFAEALMGAGVRDRLAMLANLRTVKGVSPSTSKVLRAASSGAKAAIATVVRAEAQATMKPNTVTPCSTSATVAAAASATITVTPGGGQRRWYLHFVTATDASIVAFVGTQFKVGDYDLFRGSGADGSGSSVGVSLQFLDSRSPEAWNIGHWAGVLQEANATIVLIVKNISAGAAYFVGAVHSTQEGPCGEGTMGMLSRTRARLLTSRSGGG